MGPKFLTLAEAEGSIEPGPDQQERLHELTTRLQNGEFYVAAEASIPVICIDGRYGGFHLLPNAAGGTESIFVGDDLTTRRYVSEDGSTRGGYQNVMTKVMSQGGQIGGHDSTHHGPDGSGCGANDNLPMIYDFIKRQGDTIRGIAEKLGMKVPDELHNKIIGSAAARTSFNSGAAMISALESQDKNAVIEHLDGEHKEVIAVINTKVGTTLDRKALFDQFGENYEAFNFDIWSFENAARMVLCDEIGAVNEGDVPALITGMVYYNLATAYVLVGKSLRVIVI